MKGRVKSKMGRPCLFERPLTAAERAAMRRAQHSGHEILTLASLLSYIHSRKNRRNTNKDEINDGLHKIAMG